MPLAAILLALAALLVPPVRAASTGTVVPGLGGRVTILEDDPSRARFLADAFARLLSAPSARDLARRFSEDGPSVTVRWAPLDSSALEFSGVKPVISGLSAFTRYESTYDVVSINERLLSAASPQQVAQDLGHEILGHCYERSLADRAGVGYVYAVARDNETAASLLGWLIANDLGLKQRDENPFSYLFDPDAYYAERLYMGADYAAGLTAAELPRARAVYERRAALLKKRAGQWNDEVTVDERQLFWIDHFVKDHAWPREPFSLLSAELAHMKDEEAPRSRALCLRIAGTIEDLARSLAESPEDRKLLARAARHRLLKRWARQVRERTLELRSRFARAQETQPALQARPDGELTQEDLLRMIDADLKFHEGAGKPLPPGLGASAP